MKPGVIGYEGSCEKIVTVDALITEGLRTRGLLSAPGDVRSRRELKKGYENTRSLDATLDYAMRNRTQNLTGMEDLSLWALQMNSLGCWKAALRSNDARHPTLKKLNDNTKYLRSRHALAKVVARMGELGVYTAAIVIGYKHTDDYIVLSQELDAPEILTYNRTEGNPTNYHKLWIEAVISRMGQGSSYNVFR